MSNVPWLTLLTFLPLAGAAVLASLGKQREQTLRRVALGFNLAALAVALGLWAEFSTTTEQLQFEERHAWIPTLGIQYFLALDGLGLLLVLLSALVVPFALLATESPGEHPHLYYALLLLVQAGLFGAFTALNFFHWFVFWELILVPAYFLIKLWGGPRRVSAATQFFIYTLFGSVCLLLGFGALYLATGTFDFFELARMRAEVTGGLGGLLKARIGWPGLSAQALAVLVFAGIFLGLAVKVPILPLHTWAPAAYAEAPTGVTMVLTGAMSKMGLYGILRILLPLFPEQMNYCLTPLLWLAVATILFSALAAGAQRDLKRLFAYVSINHLGYCLLGIAACLKATGADPRWAMERSAALSGVLLQMFNHGITASALFCLVAFLERRSGGLRGLDDFGGLRKVMPVGCGLMGIALFASLGLPGLNGFLGEFLIFKGAFSLAPWAAAGAVPGLLVTAIVFLTILQRVFSGPLRPQWTGLADLTVRERLVLAPAVALMFVLGFYPQLILQFTNATVSRMVARLF